MTEQLPGDEVRGRVTVEFRTAPDTYDIHYRAINKAIADEFVRAFDSKPPVDLPTLDPRRQLIRGEATEAEQSLPRPGEFFQNLGGQLPVGEIDRAQAVRGVIAKWALVLDPAHPAVAAYLARLVEKFPEIETALADNGIDLGLDDVEP